MGKLMRNCAWGVMTRKERKKIKSETKQWHFLSLQSNLFLLLIAAWIPMADRHKPLLRLPDLLPPLSDADIPLFPTLSLSLYLTSSISLPSFSSSLFLTSSNYVFFLSLSFPPLSLSLILSLSLTWIHTEKVPAFNKTRARYHISFFEYSVPYTI